MGSVTASENPFSTCLVGGLFLLLVHGYGCQDFEGMCCMGLSDHSGSVHRSILDLKEGVGQLQVDKGGEH